RRVSEGDRPRLPRFRIKGKTYTSRFGRTPTTDALGAIASRRGGRALGGGWTDSRGADGGATSRWCGWGRVGSWDPVKCEADGAKVRAGLKSHQRAVNCKHDN